MLKGINIDLKVLSWALFAGSLAIFLNPLWPDFETAITSKLVFLKDSTLFPKDFYIQSLRESYDPYENFIRLFVPFPLSWYPSLVFLGKLLMAFGVALFYYLFFQNKTDLKESSLATSLTLVFLATTYLWETFGVFALGDNAIFFPYLRNQSFAFVLGLNAIYLSMSEKRLYFTFLFLIASTYFHFQQGALTLLLVVASSLVTFGLRNIRLYVFSLIYLLGLLFYALHHGFLEGADELNHKFVGAMIYFRLPHHYRPSVWLFQDYCLYFSFTALGLFLLYRFRHSIKVSLQIFAVVAVCLIGVLVFFLAEKYAPASVFSLSMPSRLTLYQKAFLSGVIVYSLVRCLPQGQRSIHYIWPLLSAIFLIVSAFFTHQPKWSRTLDVEHYLMAQTPKEALIIVVPKRHWDQVCFRSRRSCFVDFRRFPFKKEQAVEYLERHLLLLGKEELILDHESLYELGQSDRRDLFYKNLIKRATYLKEKTKADYVVVERDQTSKLLSAGYQVKFVGQSLSVFAFPKS